MKKKKPTQSDLCPCGSGQPYTLCCARYHAGELAPDAESLMRSRYTAYVLHLDTYLLTTWHPRTRPSELDLSGDGELKWIGLQVEGSGQDESSAWVRFTACYKVNGRAGKMREKSRFLKESGCWMYVDGEYPEDR